MAMFSTRELVLVSTTETESELLLATYSRPRASSHAMAVGGSPTSTVWVVSLVVRSTRVTVRVGFRPRTGRPVLGLRKPAAPVAHPGHGSRRVHRDSERCNSGLDLFHGA